MTKKRKSSQIRQKIVLRWAMITGLGYLSFAIAVLLNAGIWSLIPVLIAWITIGIIVLSMDNNNNHQNTILEEKQRLIRDRAYRLSYQIIGGLMVVVSIMAIWKKEIAIVGLACLAVLMLVLPKAILIWLEASDRH
jgi:hypothetical protein